MSKNAKLQRVKTFGRSACPVVRSYQRSKHLSLIKQWTAEFLGIPNRITPGKLNSAGKFIKKPDWGTGYLEYEPNPEAAVHELGHLFLIPESLPLESYQSIMDKQFGFVNSRYGYMQQKRSVFEVLPTAMEQRIRRVLGLPASVKSIKVDADAPPRTAVEDKKTPIAKRVKRKDKYYDLIRLSSNLDFGARRRFERIISKDLIYKPGVGWVLNQSIDAKINRRAKS